jgi:formate hydrogenlyase subunit 6/NADH:ubiquinone oxidoreductase subunit I
MTCLFCRTCDHLVCADCILSKHNKHNFEPVEKILSEKLDDLKGAEARYNKDLTTSWNGDLISIIWCWMFVCTFRWISLHLSQMNLLHSTHLHLIFISVLQRSQSFGFWHTTKMTCLFCRSCDHLVCTDCILSKHNKHNFEPVEKILSERLDDELKGAETRYSHDYIECTSILSLIPFRKVHKVFRFVPFL